MSLGDIHSFTSFSLPLCDKRQNSEETSGNTSYFQFITGDAMYDGPGIFFFVMGSYYQALLKLRKIH